MEDWGAKLEELQAKRDDITAQIQALQRDIRNAELTAAAAAHLESMPDDERSVYIQAASARVGAKG